MSHRGMKLLTMKNGKQKDTENAFKKGHILNGTVFSNCKMVLDKRKPPHISY
jgi:hypothetical protein